MRYYFDGMSTSIGRLHIVVSDDALVRVFLPGVLWNERFIRKPAHPLIVETKKQLREYLQEERTQFDLPVHLEGTSFQEYVWKLLQSIPYGTTSTYGEIAAQMDRSNAVRACGTAVGKNPLPIIIPCHRVIRANGSIGMYAGGSKCKFLLLELEKGKSL